MVTETNTDSRSTPQEIFLSLISLGILIFLGVLLGPLFKRAFLYGYIFWMGLSLGCLGFTLLHKLTGGKWGDWLMPGLIAGTSNLRLMTLLFIPILIFLKDIYPWTNLGFMHSERVLVVKAHYLNITFFFARQIFYFLSWLIISSLIQRGEKWKWISAPGLLVYVFTITFASFDWAMSLEPRWHSSIYGAMVLVGFALAALAYLVIRHSRVPLHYDHYGWDCPVDNLLSSKRDESGNPGCKPSFEGQSEDWTPASAGVTTKAMHDTGNLMLAFVLLWAYMQFSQFLIIWNANLSDEVTWYLNRSKGGWEWVIYLVIALQFFLPLLYLLFQSNKQDLKRLARVAWLILIMHAVDLLWLLYPSFYPGKFHLDGYPVIALILVGVPWVVQFNRHYKRMNHETLT